MDVTRWVVGLAALIVTIIALSVGAQRVRRRVVPQLRGATALTADVVIALALFHAVVYVLGAFGVLYPVVTFVALIAVGGAAMQFARDPARVTNDVAVIPTYPPRTRADQWAVWLAAAAVAIVLARWLPHLFAVGGRGIYDGDSIWYHLPDAARFAQTGSITAIHFKDADPLVAFFPSNTELLHAVGILAFGRDLLSPLLNFGWLAFALLAGAAVGEQLGNVPAAVAATAATETVWVMVNTQAATGRNDTAAIALFLASAALAFAARERAAAWLVAGVAVGLTIGVKVSVLPAALAFAGGATVLLLARRRLHAAGAYLAGLVAFGSFWYVRNWVAVGNPLPWFSVHAGFVQFHAAPLPTPTGSTTLVSQAGHSGFWRLIVFNGLDTAWGPGWWLFGALAAAAVAGAGIVAVRARNGRLGAAVAAAAAGMLLYLGTPNGIAPGWQERAGIAARTLFSLNSRYVLPALTLALIAGGAACARSARTRLAATALVMVATVSIALRHDSHTYWEWRVSAHDVLAGAGLAAALAAAVAAGAWWRARRAQATIGRVVSRATKLAALAGALAVGTAVLGAWSAVFVDHRYAEASVPPAIGKVFPVAREWRDRRVALDGTQFQYPLSDARLTSHVDYLGARAPHGGFGEIHDCRTWQHALLAGNYDTVVLTVGAFAFGVDPRYTETRQWTLGVHGAHIVDDEPEVVVISLPRAASPRTQASCPG